MWRRQRGRSSVVLDVLVLGFSFTEPDTLSCRDGTFSEKWIPEDEHNVRGAGKGLGCTNKNRFGYGLREGVVQNWVL